ncbi:MAG: acyl-ACP--UDP-N-acetylglucosamine O-acyltransferase [Thermodesulfovibrionales bacterium]|nr:acyl-ACP--UDP-N-acetylglucosamine O-acyltransferase [Thermodesulfovibrionales bacterium]
MADIHPTAIVSPDAVIHKDVSIGPFCLVGKGVTIKKGTKLFSHIVVEGNTQIGENCRIYPFTTIGLPPQDLKYKDEETGVKIGDNNIIRENITIHRGSIKGDGLTEIGNDNFLMAYVHIAHDCKVGNSVIMANAATLGGHVTIGDFAVIGGLVAIHQFTRIGAYCMIGGFSGVVLDVIPYMMASGERAKLYGPNTIGLKRHGFSDEKIQLLKKVYKIIFREKNTLQKAKERIQNELPQTEEIKNILRFIDESQRGICR